jgi:CRP-like cAMP-binding protein
MSANIDATLVRKFKCFENFTDAETESVTQRLAAVQLEPGQVLFEQGQEGDSLYLVVSGEIEIRIRVPGGEDRVLSALEAGAIFGELSLLLNQVRTAGAVAKTPVTLWKMTHDEFEAALNRGDDWAAKFLLATSRVLALRLETLDKELVELIGSMRKAETPSPASRVAELEGLRKRLFSEWSF